MADNEANRQALLDRIAQFDDAFGHDRGEEMGEFFAPEARLMWPFMEDIAGREAIGAAFIQFAETFATLKWAPKRTVLRVHGERAYVQGSFIEERRERAGGRAERVFGRMVEFWRMDADGQWRIEALLTSRYGENEVLEE